MTHQRLDPAWTRSLAAQPCTFTVLEQTGNRVTTAGILSGDESEAATVVGLDSLLTLRPDKLPGEALQLGMLSLVPLYLGALSVGWLFQFPALNVTVGRNYIRVRRGKTLVSDAESPQLSVLLKSVVIMEVADMMTLVLGTRVRDMRT